MKKLTYFLLVFLLSIPVRSVANHIYGGELYYTHISGLTYKITLTLYGDCGSASPTAFNSLFAAAPEVIIKQNQNTITAITLNLDTASIKEVTPVCSAEANNTKCVSPTATLPGIKRFSYDKVYTLPSATAYSFIFEGDLGTAGGAAGRSSNITNVFGVNNQQVYLVAELFDSQSLNSSPQFTTLPTPFYCINLQQQYNQGAVDADNDSLSFSLVPALVQGSPVTYNPSFSEVYPISTVDQNFIMNAVNGQMIFTPDVVQRGLVVNKVTEYKNGQVVGTSTREMTFIVLDNCQNSPPAAAVDTNSIIGGTLTDGNIIDVCEGTPSVSFVYPIADADGDTVTITNTPLPPGATLTVSNGNTSSPTLSFSWNTSSVPAGVYNFFVTLKDSHCPLNSHETRGFTIRISDPPLLHTSIAFPTECAHKAVVEYALAGGIKPRLVTIRQGSTIIKTYTDTTGVFTDSLAAGSYTIQVASKHLPCTNTYQLTVADSGTYPYSPLFTDVLICSGSTPSPLVAIPDAGAVVHWYDMEGNALSATPVPSTAVPGTYYWLVNQQYLVCQSKKDTIKVTVAPKPEANILNQPETLCYGDKVFLKASGADQFVWLPEDKIFREPDSSEFVRIYEPSTFTVIASTGVGCKDTISISFDHIEQCCKLSYPNAFTPNGDDRNDTWHPMMYGNHEFYELSIFNRWGAVMFHSFIPADAWDGRRFGVPQDIGTYYYQVKTKCLTGHEEEQKGDFLLLR
jgi:gliding motility-associated-like protein